MSDIINLLPDSVANQIAAGEVIQRPASVVKELVENSLDSGATEIIVNIKDAGRTLIQISDNGCGMSPTDARMSFERHATSKISSANDLFCIHSLGFRGEALASIAAIADVELRTKRHEDETGTFIHIAGTQVRIQEPVACSNGTSFMVKNLFYNVPARRKFLKSNTAELKHIINEIHRIAIPNPEIKIVLYHNNSIIYDLPKTNYRKRLIDLFGKGLNQSLINVDEQTSIVKIYGYIGQPKMSRKTLGEQFFFVNGRYIRHPYFHKAVMLAYEKLIPPDNFPSYFLFLNIDPAEIDINVHPTKTEIKFENESAIWQIINASIRESLGKNNVVPSIDFDQDGNFNIPIPQKSWDNIVYPEIEINQGYNPFSKTIPSNQTSQSKTGTGKTSLAHWEDLYTGVQLKLKTEERNAAIQTEERETQSSSFEHFIAKKVMQLKQRYILIPIKSGLMVVDQKRAHERILFEKFTETMKSETLACQKLLFPQTFEMNPADAVLLKSILKDLMTMGFDIGEFGKDSFIIHGTPAILEINSPQSVLEKLLEEFKNSPVNAKDKVREQIAVALAKASSIQYGAELRQEEMDHLVDDLFACSTPNFTPDGKKILIIITSEELEKEFLK